MRRAALLSVPIALCLGLGSCASSAQPRPEVVAARSKAMLERELDGVLAQDAAWQAAETAPAKVAELWRVALSLEAERRFDVAAMAIGRMLELDPGLNSNELIMVKLIELHNQAVRHPLTVMPEPPPAKRPTMIPVEKHG